MKIVFKSIPRLARYFYVLGIIIIAVAMLNFWQDYCYFTVLLTQQVFIGGAIIVALGSVINTIFQFGKNKP